MNKIQRTQLWLKKKYFKMFPGRKHLTLAQFVTSKSSLVWVLNTAHKVTGEVMEVMLGTLTTNTTRTARVKVELTWVPQALHTRHVAKDLRELETMLRAIDKGLVTVIHPWYADILLSLPEAKEEIERMALKQQEVTDYCNYVNGPKRSVSDTTQVTASKVPHTEGSEETHSEMHTRLANESRDKALKQQEIWKENAEIQQEADSKRGKYKVPQETLDWLSNPEYNDPYLTERANFILNRDFPDLHPYKRGAEFIRIYNRLLKADKGGKKKQRKSKRVRVTTRARSA